MATYETVYYKMFDTVWEDPDDSLYGQFYNPWVVHYNEYTYDRMSLDTTAPGALEIRGLIDFYDYPPCKNGIIHPKPYRYQIPPGVAEKVILNLEKARTDEVEVVLEDPANQLPLLEPIGLSHFPEIPVEEYAYYLRPDSDEEDADEDEDGIVDVVMSVVGNVIGNDGAGDIVEDENADDGVEDDLQDMDVDEDVDEDEDIDEGEGEVEDLVKGWKKVEIEMVDRAERIVGKLELRIWRAKKKCVTIGKRFRKTVKRKWEDMGSV